MQIYLSRIRLPIRCQCDGCADSSKDTGGKDATKSQGMAYSSQKIQQAVGDWQVGRLLRKHLSVILGLRALLDFRCLAKKEIKNIQAWEEEEFLQAETL